MAAWSFLCDTVYNCRQRQFIAGAVKPDAPPPCRGPTISHAAGVHLAKTGRCCDKKGTGLNDRNVTTWKFVCLNERLFASTTKKRLFFSTLYALHRWILRDIFKNSIKRPPKMLKSDLCRESGSLVNTTNNMIKIISFSSTVATIWCNKELSAFPGRLFKECHF